MGDPGTRPATVNIKRKPVDKARHDNVERMFTIDGYLSGLLIAIYLSILRHAIVMADNRNPE